MFKQIRRQDRALNQTETLAIINNGEYGVLSTADDNNQPYGIPVSYAIIDNSIYIHSATEGHKLENIAANSKVSFCVVGKTEVLPSKFSTKYKSAIVFGTASLINGTEKRESLTALITKYSPDFQEKGAKYIDSLYERTAVIKVKIDHFSGKSRK